MMFRSWPTLMLAMLLILPAHADMSAVGQKWVATWAQAMTAHSGSASQDFTLRQAVFTSTGGWEGSHPSVELLWQHAAADRFRTHSVERDG